MAIVQCPHCGKPASSRAASCPYCHAPLNDESEKLPVVPPEQEKPDPMREVREFVLASERRKAQSNIPTCPVCRSANLSRISAAKSFLKVATFGIAGAGDVGKTWKCNNCGSKF